MNAFREEVKQRWGTTAAYTEFAEKQKEASLEKSGAIAAGMESILAEFACCVQNGDGPDSVSAQELVKKLQDYITQHFYTCTTPILAGLGQMYVADERFKDNIDKHAPGTAEFISRAIHIYCTETD